MLLESFIFSNFNHCPTGWHFCPAALSQKTQKKQELACMMIVTPIATDYY